MLASYQEFLRFSEQAEILTAAQRRSLQRQSSSGNAARVLQEAIALREALAQMFYSGSDNAALSVLNRTLSAGLSHRRIQRQQTGFAWTWERIDKSLDAPLWILAYEAAELLASNQLTQVRECSNETCRWLFLDTSKNRSRRWCDMKLCGNRLKARRFYARHKAEG